MALVKAEILCLISLRGFSNRKGIFEPNLQEFGVFILLVYHLPGSVKGSIFVIQTAGPLVVLFPSSVRLFSKCWVETCIYYCSVISLRNKFFLKVNKGLCHAQ